MDRCKQRRLAALLPSFLAIFAGGLGFFARAHAAETAYGVRSGVGRTDNIRRTATDPVEETIATAGVNFSLLEESRRLKADLAGDFSYLRYLDDTYQDEVVGAFAGQARVGFVPERFEWRFADNFGQTTQQPFAATTPENRENVNYFTTGPSLLIGAGSTMRAKLDGHYSKVTYEDSPLDSSRAGGDLALMRELSASSALSLNLHYEDVDFDDDAFNTDFDVREAFLRYDATGSRTRLGVDLGYTQFERAGQSDSGLVARLQASRRLSPAMTLSLSMGREISDAGNIFQQLQSLQSVQVAPLGTQPVQPSSDPFTNTYGTLGWEFERNRTAFGLSASRFEEEYERETFRDRARTSIAASMRRDLTPSVQLRASAERIEEEYEVSAVDFTEIYGTVLLTWRLGQRVSLELQYERFDRSADTSDQEYEENRGWLRVAYGRGSRRTAEFAPVGTGAHR